MTRSSIFLTKSLQKSSRDSQLNQSVDSATKESTKLPALHMKVEPGACSTIYGFGFDEPNDDYKVVIIVCLLRGRGRFKSIVYIYSLKTDSWTRVEDYKGNDVWTYPGTFASGKLHWLTDLDPSDFKSGLDWGVFYLDLTSELYGTLDQPNYGEGKFDSSMGVLGGCICVLCVYEETRVDLWVLKEYDVQGSWSKVINFSHVFNVGEYLFSKPLCILPNGEILLVIGASFVVCNPRYNSVRLYEKMDLGRFLEADTYVESLVSPTASGRLQRQH